MAKSCCETGDRQPSPSWKVWAKRGMYAGLIAMVLFVVWSQLAG